MRYFIVAALLCAGCEATPPPPYASELQSQCAAGSTDACGYLAQADASERQRQTSAVGLIMANNNAMMYRPYGYSYRGY
jgi:outer membrane PBP1 activator LpoA protein